MVFFAGELCCGLGLDHSDHDWRGRRSNYSAEGQQEKYLRRLRLRGCEVTTPEIRGRRSN